MLAPRLIIQIANSIICGIIIVFLSVLIIYNEDKDKWLHKSRKKFKKDKKTPDLTGPRAKTEEK